MVEGGPQKGWKKERLQQQLLLVPLLVKEETTVVEDYQVSKVELPDQNVDITLIEDKSKESNKYHPSESTKRKRGRPRKERIYHPSESTKRKRGRPRKERNRLNSQQDIHVQILAEQNVSHVEDSLVSTVELPDQNLVIEDTSKESNKYHPCEVTKRKRGRPRKERKYHPSESTKRKRGRPRKEQNRLNSQQDILVQILAEPNVSHAECSPISKVELLDQNVDISLIEDKGKESNDHLPSESFKRRIGHPRKCRHKFIPYFSFFYKGKKKWFRKRVRSNPTRLSISRRNTLVKLEYNSNPESIPVLNNTFLIDSQHEVLTNPSVSLIKVKECAQLSHQESSNKKEGPKKCVYESESVSSIVAPGEHGCVSNPVINDTFLIDAKPKDLASLSFSSIDDKKSTRHSLCGVSNNMISPKECIHKPEAVIYQDTHVKSEYGSYPENNPIINDSFSLIAKCEPFDEGYQETDSNPLESCSVRTTDTSENIASLGYFSSFSDNKTNITSLNTCSENGSYHHDKLTQSSFYSSTPLSCIKPCSVVLHDIMLPPVCQNILHYPPS